MTDNYNSNDIANFIWMGDLSTDTRVALCRSGPESLAQVSEGTSINVWVRDKAVAKAEEVFQGKKNIQVRSIDKMLNGEDGELKFIKTKVGQIKRAIDSMDKTNSFAAQKDLLSFAIMAEYGGYFFDTTTKFYNNENGSPKLPQVNDIKVAINFDDQRQYAGLIHMSKPPTKDEQQQLKQSQYILTNTGFYYYSCWEKSLKTINLSAEQLNELQEKFKEDDPKLTNENLDSIKSITRHDHKATYSPFFIADLWAFASSKPGNKIFTESLNEYLMQIPPWTDEKTGVAMQCFVEVLIEKYKQTFEINRDLCWQANDLNNGTWDVPELNMKKFNTGSWRNREIQEGDRNHLAYQELGLAIPNQANAITSTGKVFAELNVTSKSVVPEKVGPGKEKIEPEKENVAPEKEKAQSEEKVEVNHIQLR